MRWVSQKRVGCVKDAVEDHSGRSGVVAFASETDSFNQTVIATEWMETVWCRAGACLPGRSRGEGRSPGRMFQSSGGPTPN